MDERVEITNVPQPLQPHPDAPITAHADSYPKASDAEAIHQPRRNATRLWAALPFICVIGAAVSVLLGNNTTPLGYAFDRAMRPRTLSSAMIILTYSSVVFSIISLVRAVGSDELMPNPRRVNYAIGCLSLLISVGVALL